MQPTKLKKWVRVAGPLLLASLVAIVLLSRLFTPRGVPKVTPVAHGRRDHRAHKADSIPVLQMKQRSKNNLRGRKSAKLKTSKGITLAVVEEHHEVIPYWFKAASLGIIPKTGNTLIHIDGHSDLGLPPYHPKMSYFHWPTTKDQLHHLMHENDDFIQAAMIAGLISRMIFIYPSWDKGDNTTFAITTAEIGTLHMKNSKEPTFCCCMFVASVGKQQCMHFEKSDGEVMDGNDGMDGIITDTLEGCKVRKRCRIEQAVDHVALKKLKTRSNWFGSSGNIILDIDEDYFGVELAGQSLVDAGLKWDTVALLEHPLRKLFCPRQIAHEARGNDVMRETIATVIRMCRLSLKSDDAMCRGVIVAMLQSQVHKTMLPHWKHYPRMFCAKTTERLYAVLNELTVVLMKSKLRHLRVLMEFGFCLETTPASIGFRTTGFGSLLLCHGTNTPNDSTVFLHTPNTAEIRARTSQLRKMLEIIDDRHRPNVVTLCRSVRDGYTPRSLFRSIESNILDIFHRLPGQYDVIYDENLYGGKEGWPNRNKIKSQ